jgi:GGDEF domain-containing protein
VQAVRIAGHDQRGDPAIPGQPAVAELACNGTTGTVLAVEPNRPRRVPVGEIGDRKLDLLIRDFARLINSEVALLCQGGGRGQPPAVISSWGLGTTHEEVARPREGGLVGRAPPMRRAALEPLHPLLDSSLVHATHPPLRYAAAAPVRLPNAVAGRLIAGFVTPPRDRTLTLWTAESYAALMALYLTDPGALDALLARRDGLTGCLTYDGLRHELDREINRSARDGLQLSVCVIALDSFKPIDDDLGHPCPNAILALVASNLRTSVRSYDTLGRYGRHQSPEAIPDTSRRGHGGGSWLARGRTFAEGPSVCGFTGSSLSPRLGQPAQVLGSPVAWVPATFDLQRTRSTPRRPRSPCRGGRGRCAAVQGHVERLSRRGELRCRRALGGGAIMEGVKRGEDEAEFYREIVRRAKRVRERAAESLRLSRLSRKRQGNVGRPGDAPPRSRHRD